MNAPNAKCPVCGGPAVIMKNALTPWCRLQCSDMKCGTVKVYETPSVYEVVDLIKRQSIVKDLTQFLNGKTFKDSEDLAITIIDRIDEQWTFIPNSERPPVAPPEPPTT